MDRHFLPNFSTAHAGAVVIYSDWSVCDFAIADGGFPANHIRKLPSVAVIRHMAPETDGEGIIGDHGYGLFYISDGPRIHLWKSSGTWDLLSLRIYGWAVPRSGDDFSTVAVLK